MREMVKAGQKVVFDENGSYAESKSTGHRQYFKDKNGSYVLELWMEGTEEPDACSCTTCGCDSDENKIKPEASFLWQEVIAL